MESEGLGPTRRRAPPKAGGSFFEKISADDELGIAKESKDAPRREVNKETRITRQEKKRKNTATNTQIQARN